MKLRGILLPVLLAAFTVQAGAQPAYEAGSGGPGFSSPDAIAQRLEEVRAERARPAVDAAATQTQLLAQLEVALLQHQEAVGYLAKMRMDAEEVRETLRTWKGLDAPPPYSVGFANDLRAERQSVDRQLQATRSRLRIIDRVVDDTSDTLKEHQRALRQFREEAETEGSAEVRRAAAAAAAREEIRSRIATETLARLRLRHSAHEIQEAALASALDLANLKIAEIRGKVQFTAEELDETLRRIEDERSGIVEAALLAGSPTGVDDRQITWKLDLLDIERNYTNALHIALNSGDETDRAAALQTIRGLKARMDDWFELLRLQAREQVETDAADVGVRASPADIQHVVGLRDKLTFALEELGDEGVSGPTALDRLKSALLALWGVELYLAEETASIGGEKVTIYSAVTLGKLVRLVTILLIGWFVLRFLSSRLHALLSRRPGLERGRADTIRGWVFGLGLALLILYGLNRVHIPFTAFAFLGGTLAIGIGFGAQTLLKNFISGVILSLERPFKVGDLVQVDDITGYIRRIGMRASVIQHFDGTDTLVPNSSLLENRVNNWTYGDPATRGQVEVGVAYGSSTRETMRALLAVAESHELVLDHPEPSVQLVAFGDNALGFRLLYWYDALHTRPQTLASDLRLMIEKALTEAGIVIAFPQRDIHFDESKPLRIELSQAARGAAEDRPGD